MYNQEPIIMKKYAVLLAVVLFTIISSCSSSSGFESTIRKIAKLICREKQLEKEIRDGSNKEKASEELEKVKAEHEKLKQVVQEKYKDYVEDSRMIDKALEIRKEEMANCH